MRSKTIETATAVNTLDGVRERLDDAVKSYDDRVTEIRRDPNISGSLRDRRLTAARDAADADVNGIEWSGRDALVTLDQHGHSIIPRDDAVLYEMQERRAADRLLRQLDNGANALGLIVAAEKAGDEVGLAALRAELPATSGAGLLGRVDVALARLAGVEGSRATARVLHGPLSDRLDAQVTRARSAIGFGGRGDLGRNVALSIAEQNVAAARRAIEEPAGTPFGDSVNAGMVGPGTAGPIKSQV